MPKLIAIVDDDPDILGIVSFHVANAGFEVEEFLNAESLFESLEKRKPDLILLDIMLPDMDGFEVCQRLRKNEKFSGIPIIMLTGKDEEADRVRGLELGADDYVVKPFSLNELVARVKAVLRRPMKEKIPKKIKIDDKIVIDQEKHEVTVDGEKVDLTPVEFKILCLLSSHKGRVHTREDILEYLWGDEKIVVDRTIDVHIRHLREKLGAEADLIENVRGIGYKLRKTETD
ncbi:MAG: response regulator transcription factor [Candidatus Omnitrophota bacterium]